MRVFKLGYFYFCTQIYLVKHAGQVWIRGLKAFFADRLGKSVQILPSDAT